MSKIVCFGELLLRMSPTLGGRWISDAAMPVYVGGAELNVAGALVNWEVPVKYITTLPDHYLSHEIIGHLTQRGIDTTGIGFSGNRIGTYYLPQGADLKNAGVIYDRAHSSFANQLPGTINWPGLLEGASWFHFSAISPALTANAAAVCLEAVQAARSLGITISVDLNYRAKLWQYGKAPIDVMPELVQYCHVIMGNLWAAEQLLGIASPIADSTGKTTEALIDAAGKSMLQVHQQYPNATTMAYTYRLPDTYWGVLQHGQAMVAAKPRVITTVVDKVGSGDCFMAGLIYGLYRQHQPQQIIDFAAAAAHGKLAEVGDATQQTIQQVNEKLLNGK